MLPGPGGLGPDPFDGLGQLAYPMADVAICALVLTLGMRQPPADRLPWLCLGAGLVSLAVTDSIYVRCWRTASPTHRHPTGDRLGGRAGADRPGHPDSPGHGTGTAWDFALAVALVPYVPVAGRLVVLGVRSVRDDAFLLVGGMLLLVTVAIRQVMIVYENLILTRDLEQKVAARTAELATLGSIVTSSRDAIVGLSPRPGGHGVEPGRRTALRATAPPT